MERKRIVYFDHLRVAAIIAVMVIHVATQNWTEVRPGGFQWQVFNIYDGIVRWSVPVLLMISGPLFLKKEIPTKTLYTKYIPRLAIAYLVWSAFYAIVIPVGKSLQGGGLQLSFTSVLTSVIEGELHMWFIPMIIGIYMCVPLIRRIVRSREATRYHLLLSFLFVFVIPQAADLARDFIGGPFSDIIGAVEDLASRMSLDTILGYSFYFILGYYLNETQLSKKQRTTICILGVIGTIASFALNALVTWKTQEPCSKYFGNFTVNVLLEAVCVHTLAKYTDHGSQKWNALLCKLSKLSFGAFLVHIFVMDAFVLIGLDTLRFWPIISIPVISMLTALVSFGISWVLSKIPVINEWLI